MEWATWGSKNSKHATQERKGKPSFPDDNTRDKIVKRVSEHTAHLLEKLCRPREYGENPN